MSLCTRIAWLSYGMYGNQLRYGHPVRVPTGWIFLLCIRFFILLPQLAMSNVFWLVLKPFLPSQKLEQALVVGELCSSKSFSSKYRPERHWFACAQGKTYKCRLRQVFVWSQPKASPGRRNMKLLLARGCDRTTITHILQLCTYLHHLIYFPCYTNNTLTPRHVC